MIKAPPPAEVRKRRGRTRPAPRVPVALTLIAAAYDPDLATLTLTFDRPINVTAFETGQLDVNDTEFRALRLEAVGGAWLSGPLSVVIELAEIDASSGSGVRLSATGATGIRAADDGGTWAGVTDLALPFP